MHPSSGKWIWFGIEVDDASQNLSKGCSKKDMQPAQLELIEDEGNTIRK